MSSFRKIIFVIAAFSLASCASLSEKECEHADWTKMGYEDGSKGRPQERFVKLYQACRKHGVSVNQSDYVEAREKGLETVYCTEKNGMNIGESGININPVCTGESAKKFEAGYQKGLVLHLEAEEIKKRECNTDLDCTIQDYCSIDHCARSGAACNSDLQCEIHRVCGAGYVCY